MDDGDARGALKLCVRSKPETQAARKPLFFKASSVSAKKNLIFSDKISKKACKVFLGVLYYRQAEGHKPKGKKNLKGGFLND